jgi:hypothetical protein
MSNFTTRIQTPNGALQFYLNHLYTINGVCYHVSVTDRQNKSHVFYMQEENGQWNIRGEPNIPDWIQSVESDLQLAIKNHWKSFDDFVEVALA